MAYLAVNKNGTEVVSDNALYRNGTYKRYRTCYPDRCGGCYRSASKVLCPVDEDGRRYQKMTYSDPPEMSRDEAIEELSFWDTYEFDLDGNPIAHIVALPKGSIKKLIGREMTWADDPIEI